MEVEGSSHRWREAMRGGGEQKEVEGTGSDQRWRQETEVERSNQRRRGAIRGEVEGHT